MLSYGLVLNAVLLVAGCWWCKEMFGRFSDDVAELKAGDWTTRAALTLVWAITAGVMLLIVRFVVGLVLGLRRAL